MKTANLYKQIFNEASKVSLSGKCLWDACQLASIKSHSHAEKLLRNIGSNNHVYGVTKNALSLYKGNFFQRYGVKQASIFNGFCNIHDNNLFSDIEDSDLDSISNKDAFLLLMKSIFFEYYQKQLAILRFRKLEKLLQVNKLSANYGISDAAVAGFQFYIDNDFPIYEKKIYKIFQDLDYDNVMFRYRKIEKTVPISISTNINPFFNGHIPVDGIAQPIFSFHILPYKNYSLIVMSWLKEYDDSMAWVKEKFDSNFNKFINYLCFVESEDYFISPKFYEEKIKSEKEFFNKAFGNRTRFPDFGYKDTKIFFDFCSDT